MILENSYVETVSGKYPEGYAIDEYKGEVKLVAAREWQGKIFAQWGYKQMGKKGDEHPADKPRPMGVFLGDRQMAINRLLEAAVLLGWQPKTGTILPKNGTTAADGQPEPPDDDIPF